MSNKINFEIESFSGEVLSHHYDILSALEALHSEEPEVNNTLYRCSDRAVMAMRCNLDQWFVLNDKLTVDNNDSDVNLNFEV